MNTPGPWKVIEVDRDGVYAQLEVHGGSMGVSRKICNMYYVTPEARIDANAIAALPDCVLALQRAKGYIQALLRGGPVRDVTETGRD